jgi:conjugative relaxase-like TrwC/TraI family protein
MLRITQQSSPDAARQYYASADYYAEGQQELIGRWGGEGAKMLGLEGPVSKQAFNALCENRDPRTGERLTPRTKDDRTVGYDFTWSVPKSVSVLYALTEDRELLAAFRESVRETMADIEAEMKARVRKNGRNEERTTGNLAYGEFVHFTGRPVNGIPDPQLHAHCFVFNATLDSEEQQWKAGQFRDLKRDAPYWQAAFRMRLANRLQGLGYALERKRDDFEIKGVAPATIRRFSRRTEKIEELAREKGIEDPEAKARLGALSRERKDKSLTWAELTREWDGRLTPAERQALLAAKGQGAATPAPQRGDAAAVDFAVRHVFEREAVVSENQLLAEALKHGLGSATVEGVRREYERLPLLRQEVNGRRLVTTRNVLAEEDRMVAFAREGRGACKPLGVPGRPPRRDWLKADQKRAVRHILGSRDRVILVRGAAGAGKTTLLQEAAEAIEQGGKRLTVLAPSAKASRKTLRDEEFKTADTVARFLLSEEMQRQAAGQVVVVDEAGLLGSRDMGALFEVARRVNARVILLGDRFQNSSPARGAPLKLLEDQAGLPSVTVDEIVRQRGKYKQAMQLLSQGKTGEGFDALDKLGWILEVPDADRYRRLAEAYLQFSAEKKKGGKDKSVLVVTPTHREAALITAAIRAELTAQGRLGVERELPAWAPLHLTEAERGEAANYAEGDMVQFHQKAKGGYRSGQRLVVGAGPLPLNLAARFQAFRPTVVKVAAGDRLRITANGNTADGRHRLANGSIYRVKGFTPEENIVLDNGWVIGRDFGHIAPGYAVTSWSSQSQTVDVVLVGESLASRPASGRAGFYVETSRGRERTLIFTDDKQALRESVTRDREKLTATEVFRPRKPPGRERLRRHMSFMRRWASQQRPRERSGRDHLPFQKEATYER